MRKAATLTELLVVVAIIATIVATIVGLLLPLFLPHSSSNPKDTGNDPPVTIHMWTVQHDGHWWVKSIEHFVHHPDCPCLKRNAEAVE